MVREIGRGYEPLQNFSRVANLHGMTHTCYDAVNDRLKDAYESVANKSMSKAAETNSQKKYRWAWFVQSVARWFVAASQPRFVERCGNNNQ